MRRWFLNLSVRAKFSLALGSTVVLLLMVILVLYGSMKDIQRTQKRAVDVEFANAIDLLQDLRQQNAIRAAQLDILILSDRAAQEAWHQDITTRSQIADEIHQRLLARNQNDPAFISKINELISVRNDFKEVRETQIIPLIYQGKINEAKELILGGQLDRFNKMKDIVENVEKQAAQRSQEAVQQSAEIVERSARLFMIGGALAVLLGLVMVTLLNRVIAKPLKEISHASMQIASGNLAVNLSINDRMDEVGGLTRTFGRMTQYLQENARVADSIAAGDLRVKVKPASEGDVLGNAFGSMVENLRETTDELTESVNVLATSASEILASTTEVAASAVQAATAITETTTTVEEVKQTGQLSNQKAKYVLDSSQKATQVALTGRKSVEASVEGMKRIQAQMESIAESTVKLSEQTQAIGEIIATVNDLAEQSNLLAVNAAIEAAKAGEQGKGFAVVAQEIRSLAEQSKQATAQVRNILSDIQKATSAAVMATEQGTKAVEAGVKQSAEAGDSIRVLADTIAEAAQAATQIAASSQQQLVGTDQVALAMENIKQASMQNAAGTKQAETAAHNLHELGQKLKHLVERYKV